QRHALLALAARVRLVRRGVGVRVAGVGLADAVLDARDHRAPRPAGRLHVAPARHEGRVLPPAARVGGHLDAELRAHRHERRRDDEDAPVLRRQGLPDRRQMVEKMGLSTYEIQTHFVYAMRHGLLDPELWKTCDRPWMV